MDGSPRILIKVHDSLFAPLAHHAGGVLSVVEIISNQAKQALPRASRTLSAPPGSQCCVTGSSRGAVCLGRPVLAELPPVAPVRLHRVEAWAGGDCTRGGICEMRPASSPCLMQRIQQCVHGASRNKTAICWQVCPQRLPWLSGRAEFHAHERAIERTGRMLHAKR